MTESGWIVVFLVIGLPRMRRAGRTDGSDLQVSVNELTPVSEPLYAVA